MKEMVIAKVSKLLGASITYPIANSKWVNPTKVVSKKIWINAIINDDGEMVLVVLL